MQKPTIQDYQLWLNSNKINLIQIYDDRKTPINNAKYSAKDVLNDFDGNIMGIFEAIKTKHPELNKIHIQKLQRSGTSFKNRQELWPFDLIDKRVLDGAAPNPTGKATTMQTTPPQYAQQVHPAKSQAPTGLMGQMGLSMPDIMSMNTAKEQLPEVKRERDEWKAKFEKIEAENKRLERENLKYELGIEGKPGALEQLLELVAKNPAMIGEIVGAAKAGKTAEITEGLTGQQTDSPTKNSFIKVICDPRFTEENTIICYNVGKALASGDEALKQKIKNIFNPQTATQDA